ncbi:uncharacterized protein LOC135923316 [Gordionus sp. m RMFG-2023]|uniref:uncharacterized protein LOC135923316 n=1 Tax=Gordionus sp. m RMFG-2023 TaxID=3053472 RepID=UPI0031FC584A
MGIKATEEKFLQATVMRMIWWRLGYTKLDHMTNDCLRAKMGIQPMADLINENRLRWYGHILRRETNDVNRKVLDIEVPGKRGRGRPRITWKGQVDKVMMTKKINPDMALTRSRWKKLIKTNPTTVGLYA